MQVLLQIGTGAAARSTRRAARLGPTVPTAGRRSAAAAGATAAGHAVRGRGARRTGVARPEWAPQVREVERRRGAPKLHLRRDRVAAVA